MVLHDFDLGRTTSGSGLVHEQELSAIRHLSAGAWFGDAFQGEKVPLLEEVLAIDGIDFELELKGLPTKALVDAVVSCVRSAGVTQRVEFTGYYLPTLLRTQELLADASYGLFAPMHQAWMTDRLFEQLAVETAVLSRFTTVHVPLEHLHRVDAEHLHARGLRLHQGGDAVSLDALR